MRGALSLCALAAPLAPALAAELRCRLQDADRAAELRTGLTADPYAHQVVQLDHFRFAAVMVGDGDAIDYVKVYAFYVADSHGARMLHAATYTHPRPLPDPAPDSLTGTVRLYEPRIGREFRYGCALVERAP